MAPGFGVSHFECGVSGFGFRGYLPCGAALGTELAGRQAETGEGRQLILGTELLKLAGRQAETGRERRRQGEIYGDMRRQAETGRETGCYPRGAALDEQPDLDELALAQRDLQGYLAHEKLLPPRTA
jgi:hypothetical protein